MKPTKNLIYILLLFVFLFSQYSLVFSASTYTFNPNFIISDDEMQNYKSMNRADIQAFLENYDSYLGDLKIEDKEGVERMASDIISRASEEHRINPKYLLVKLQKEQSLITEDSPTQKQLDGATGYGITDGCGWSCESYLNNQGFGKQVDSAAGIMRWYYDKINSESWIKKPGQSYSIDGTDVIPQSFATAFLYTYTPHLQGNENFWRLWQKWFDQVYPNGSLIKAKNGSTVYLIQDGQKRAIASMAVLASRFDPKMILTVPESELGRYEEGNKLSLPNYSILKNGSKYYLVDYDTVRPFASYEVVKKLGYNPGEIVDITSDDLIGYNIGSEINTDTVKPLGKIVKLKENNSIYLLKDNYYYPIQDEIIAKINYPNIKIESGTVAEISSFTKGPAVTFKDGTLFGIIGSNKIYVAEGGKKRHIATEEVFVGLGYNWKNIVWVNEYAGMIHENGEPLYLRAKETITTKISTEDTISSNGFDSPITEPGKMLTTPAAKTVYVGEKFTTNMDTYLVADYKTGKILAGKNIDVVRPTASFTKVMTAYQLFQDGLKMSRSATYDEDKHKSTYHQFRIVDGEKILNKDLMDAMLLSSINTAAKILTFQVATNETAFVKQMNSSVLKWGLKNTKFTDSYGFDLGNVTTAREFLTIFSKTTSDVNLRDIMGKTSYEYDEVLDLDKKPKHFDEHSNHLVNKTGLGFNILASKTGYLDEAGAGLVMLVERPSDKKQFVVITMGNPDYAKRFDEPEKLTKWALKTF